jgi:hydrogenase 3 maturation protease
MWLAFDCGTVPENFTSLVKKERPRLLVIVDAAELSLAPGEFRVIPKDMISSASIGTHSMSLSHLVSYLEKYAKKVVFVGIQPKVLADTDELSPELVSSAEKLMKLILENRLSEIPVL